jgi:RND family efflux transporter MFP subunit
LHFRFTCNSGQRRLLRWVGLLFWVAAACSGAAEELPALDCVVNPNLIVDLSSPVPGVLDEVLVERSDVVEKGQVVARLAAGVERAGVNLAIARAKLDPEIYAGMVNVQFDRKRRDRLDSLYGNDVIAIQSKEEAEREAQLSVWNLERARDRQKERVLELKRAEELLAQKTIRSTIGGVVVDRFKSAGEYVEDQPIVRIVQLDPLRIDAIVPMKYFGQIKPGMTAIVHPEAINISRQATVTVVDPLGDAASGTFGVRLMLPNPDYTVPAGMRCEMKIIAGSGPQPGTDVTEQITARQKDASRQHSLDEAVSPPDSDNTHHDAHRAKLAWNLLAESIWNLLSLSMSETVQSESGFEGSMASSRSAEELRNATKSGRVDSKVEEI